MMKTHRQAGLTIVLMLLASLGLFVTGIFLPFTAVTKLWVFENLPLDRGGHLCEYGWPYHEDDD